MEASSSVQSLSSDRTAVSRERCHHIRELAPADASALCVLQAASHEGGPATSLRENLVVKKRLSLMFDCGHQHHAHCCGITQPAFLVERDESKSSGLGINRCSRHAEKCKPPRNGTLGTRLTGMS